VHVLGRDAVLRVVRYSIGTVVGVVMIGVSGIWLKDLAAAAGFPHLMAYSLPIAVDATGILGTLYWITGTGLAKVWGRGVAIGALVASMFGNAVSHLVTAGELTMTWQLVIGISVVYPLVGWLVLHMLALPERSKPVAKPKAAARPATSPTKPVAQAARSPAARHPQLRAVAPVNKEQAVLTAYHQLVAEGHPNPSYAAIDQRAGTSGYAKKVDALRAAQTHAHPVAVNQ
jgi:hypothetical protein